MAHGFTAPVFGWLTDKLGGRMLMMVGLITMAASLVRKELMLITVSLELIHMCSPSCLCRITSG